ncbi:MAG TPA: hypothetical protein GXZ90_08350 [Clostridiales bacterium]|nr:hypothetical protein [Clostridiales bacterium]
MKKERNDLVMFLVGIIMLIAGLYWFMSSVTVSTGFYTGFFGRNTGGLIVVPFIVGVAWLFAKPDSIGAKIVLILSIVIILASVIAGTRLYFRNKNLYEYLIILVAIVGGAALTFKVLLAKPKDSDTIDRDFKQASDDYNKLQNELDDLKRNIK